MDIMIRSQRWLSTKLHQMVNSQPARCVLCARHSRRFLCPCCHQDLPRNPSGCLRCAQPLPRSGHLCGRCLKDPPTQARTIAPFIYSFPTTALITGFKYQKRLVFGRALADAWLHANPLEGEPKPDVIVPMPLHWWRRLGRGFNQAGELADSLGGALDIPVDYRLCRRVRSTPTQTGLSRQQRQRNLKAAFRITSAPPHHVAIVDDVVTTASSGGSLASALIEAGASRVDVWAMAKTP